VTVAEMALSVRTLRWPITGIRSVCYAPAVREHLAAAPPRRVRKSRRFIYLLHCGGSRYERGGRYHITLANYQTPGQHG
jgi:hypothetical protein